MAETKFLNLDDLAEAEVVKIKLNGKEHVFKEMSVKDFLWAQTALKKLLKDAGDEQDQIVMMVDILARQFPTTTKDELLDLGLTKLRMLTDFVENLASKGTEAVVAEAEKQGKEIPTAA